MSWQTLQADYPWPTARPEVTSFVHGWLVHKDAWGDLLGHLVRPIVLELGAWTGKTSGWLLDTFSGLRLVACDLWAPSNQLSGRLAAWSEDGTIPAGMTLRDLYVRNLWHRRDRCVMVQGQSVECLRAVAEHLRPSVVYVDADHSYRYAVADIREAVRLFPRSVICGDDYANGNTPSVSVNLAVHEVADEMGFSVVRRGRFWRYV